MLHEEIKSGIKDAMIARDTVRLEVLRGLVTAFMNQSVASGHTPQDMLTDEEALAVIARSAKQHKDSIEQFTKGGRMDLVAEETGELAILEAYLPKMMDKSEVLKIVTEMKDEQGITDTTKKGLFMASVMKELKGKADGTIVKEVVDSLF